VKKDSLKRRWVKLFFQEQGGWWRQLPLFLLVVISWVYGVGVWIRTTLYQRGFFKTRQLPCRVLSVGNITLGGTGKTHLVAVLARELLKQGMHVGILSRGYKGSKEKQGGVLSDGTRIYLTPAEAGDEPFMLAQMLSGVPVLVGKKRYEMGIHAHERFGIDVLILDDGFQHLRIKRDVDVVLIDAQRGFGNGRLFPRGPLREPLRCLRRASMLILTKAEPSQSLDAIEGVLSHYAPAIPLYHSRYKPIALMEGGVGRVLPPQFIQGKKVLAFAGIADPGYFVYLLQGLGADVVHEVHFSDHHQYTPKDVQMICEYRDTVDVFVTTEKDYVKLQEIPLNDLPIFVLTIEQEISEGAFYQSVLSFLSP
jgi:tetraacyldisaccharide 4'-kinase